MMSRWPDVTGSYVPGQTATVSATPPHRDRGVAVGPLDVDVERRLRRWAARAPLEHGPPARREEPGEVGFELSCQIGEHRVGRVEQHQVVRDSGGAIRGKATPGVLPADRASF